MLAFEYSSLADLNALLNAIATVLIVAGLVAIRAGREAAHKALMTAAAAVSAAFLVSYLVYHAHVGSVPFEREGVVRWVYLAILVSHIVLAAVQVPLILITLWLGFRDRRERHRRIARITAPVWLYVSVTGVVIYWMLYWS